MKTGFSKYRILEKIGEGGMGEVYKAEDPDLKRIVAIKVISSKESADSNRETRFLREARAAASVNHPNIVSIFDLGKKGGKFFIVMEYVEGESLRKKLRHGPVRIDSLLSYASEVCLALEEAHSRGLLHRDVKPENILIAPGDRVKLVDFGLARKMESADEADPNPKPDRITDSGTAVGTPYYMSPEQLRGDELDARSDIFSLGIVMYEMATGRLPFSGSNPLAIAASILKDRVMPITVPPESVGRKLTSIVERCLEKDPARRFESATSLRKALEKLKRELDQESERLTGDPFATPTFLISPAPALLVLPFETVGSAEEVAFATGLAHAIITDLARIPGLSVLSKTAGAAASDGQQKPRDLARELQATLLLEGEVMRAGETVAVMARLIDVSTGHVLWGSRFRGTASDIFHILDSVCKGIVDALPVHVSARTREDISRPATSNVEAFELYSKGHALLERYDIRENISTAINLLEKAVALDPKFALAHAALGEACWRKYENTHDSSWVRRSITSCDYALVLDPGQARVYVSLAITYFGTGRIDEAIEELNRALALQPGSDDAYNWLGRCYEEKRDRPRALAAYQQAIALRPAAEHYLQLGACYLTFANYEDAIEQFRKVISIQPDNYSGYNNLGSIYYLLGQYEDALAILQKATQIHASPDAYSNLGSTLHALARYEEAVDAFQKAVNLEPRNDVYHRNLGDAYLGLSNMQAANEEFTTACDLLHRELGINSSNAYARARLAVCLAKIGNSKEACKEIQAALDGPPKETVSYLAAVVKTMAGDLDSALQHLRSALSLGFSPHEARHDPDLTKLRALPQFQEILALGSAEILTSDNNNRIHRD